MMTDRRRSLALIPGETATCPNNGLLVKGGIIDCDNFHQNILDALSTLNGRFNLGHINVTNVSQAKTILASEIAHLSPNCRRVLPTDLASHTGDITFLDARTSPDLQAIVLTNNAVTLLNDPTNASAGISGNVVLGSAFFSSGAGRQGITILHEFLHYDLQMDDKTFDTNYKVN